MIKVSLIVPCRNEQRFIEELLHSLLAQDYPQGQLEILIVDGQSSDGTREIIKAYRKKYPCIKLIDNPRFIIPVAMNLGIAQAQGEVVMKMDAHTLYPKNYVSKCVQALKEYDVDNVGGILIAKSSAQTLRAHAIAYALMHPFGVGSSPFRRQQKNSPPRQVDTVAFGCYKKDVFTRIGGYNENLARSSDMELNLRLKRAGGKILLIPTIVAYYYPAATFLAFWKHNVNDGIWATYPMRFTKKPLSLRHYAPLAFVISIITFLALGLYSAQFFFSGVFLLLLYLLAAALCAIAIALREGRAVYLLLIPIVFFIRHIGYGLGSLIGLVKIIL